MEVDITLCLHFLTTEHHGKESVTLEDHSVLGSELTETARLTRPCQDAARLLSGQVPLECSVEEQAETSFYKW